MEDGYYLRSCSFSQAYCPMPWKSNNLFVVFHYNTFHELLIYIFDFKTFSFRWSPTKVNNASTSPVYRKSCAEFVNKVIYRYLLEFVMFGRNIQSQTYILAIHSCTKIFDIDFLTKRIYLFCKSVELIHHLFKQLGFNVNDFHNNDIFKLHHNFDAR